MIENLTKFLIESIRQNGAQSVFFGAIIEQLVGVLIPSPIIPMSAGFLLISQNLDSFSALLAIFSRISLPYSMGVMIGASLFYLVARFGSRLAIDKYGRFFGLKIKHIDKFRKRFTTKKK